ncbi:FtsK/SpoIIIE domain-containing protein [Cryptosporangium sp. NPDC048952]|uniref:FtsK/SpoIIIE domain-containing protein n=1 Tax=Cryptosporangium sp. NPDC048952 TaxID=3363961 RepID=UPI003716F6D2
MTGRHRDRYGYGLGIGFVPPSLVGILLGFAFFLVVKTVHALSRTVWRYRSELAPLVIAGALTVAGWYWHYTHPRWALPIAVSAWVVVLVLVLLPSRWAVVRRSWLPRRIERAYAALCVALAGTWLSATITAGPGTGPIPGLGLLFTLAGAVPWWVHRRRRARIQVDRMLSAWPGVADQIGLTGSKVASATVGKFGYVVRLALRRGQTVQQAVRAAGGIESGLGARPGSVRIEADPVRADRAIVRVMQVDPLARSIPYPEPTGRGSILRPFPLGVFEDATALAVRLAYRNALIGGVVGAGKSGVLNVLLAGLVACPDVLVWGIDLKGGMELLPWMPSLARLAVEPDQAVRMLRDAVAELDRRAAEQAAASQRLWQPRPARPALVLVVDEWAELPAAAGPLADSLARRGRAVCVTLLAATQRPTQKAMQGGAIRSQMDVRICLRVREARDVDLILGQGMNTAGWNAQSLDAPGKLLISDPDHVQPRPARAYWLPDDAVSGLAAIHAPVRPRDLAERPHVEQPPPEPSAVPSPTIPAQRESNEKTTTAEQKLCDALAGAPEEGTEIGELIQVTGMSRAWVYRQLSALARQRQATQAQRGRWRATR